MTEDISKEELERQKDELFEIGKFGIEVDNFIKGNIGQYLLDKAGEYQAEAVSKMREADITNITEMASIQNDLKVPNLVLMWLSEAINAGEAARAQLHQLDQMEE